MAAEHWTEVRSGHRWRRSDGAVVRWDQSSPYPNPANPASRMWTAWEPDPSQGYVGKEVGRPRKRTDGAIVRLTVPRRWKTPQAAMKFVDQEYPVKISPEQTYSCD